ncbi:MULTISPECIES: PH domain-containing protein [Macrococcus]|uniref:PH domain-containing protein n=1 Tax=Macrococcus psychrotolerans TaxID=3039389 RepID=A0AAU6REP6_9STAP|nr:MULTISPECIES: PH domain-containing protein [Macrococcus]MDJ1112777.1 PH domain-containing protein [Macrococcus sp. S115]QYA32638.1 PH domain-containing protein [Macrococcus sp. 19Msa1099]QYA37450.1 PH domain-containing protein [Macrococcus caseolyticus]QYA76157.1 PH domain-containing protein [Macrococcus caseolyticus]
MYEIDLNNFQPQAAVKYMYVKAIMLFILFTVISGVIYFVMHKYLTIKYDFLIFILLLYPLYKLIIGVRLRQKYTKYQLNRVTLELSSGAYFTERMVLPVDIMQSVCIKRGWLMQKYRLAQVTVYTRGDSNVMPLMYADDAELIASQIIERIKEIHYEQ